MNRHFFKLIPVLFLLAFYSCNLNKAIPGSRTDPDGDTSQLSDPVNDTDPPIPGDGGNITISHITSNSLILSWSPASDDNTPADELSYRIYYSTNPSIATIDEIKKNATPFTDWIKNTDTETINNLKESLTSYNFNIIVKDAAGNEKAYHTVSVPDNAYPTVSVSNIINGGIAHSGFIIGQAFDDTQVSTIKISIDNGHYSTVTDTTGSDTVKKWKFKVLSGTSAWREGTHHTIKVFSVDNKDFYSTTINLSFTIGGNEDINGDGYSDIVIGAPGYNGDTGKAYIFYGSDTGIQTCNLSSGGTAGTTLTGEVVNSNFGSSVAIGDLNGDGFADVAVGARKFNDYQGSIYIFYSPGSKIPDEPATIADTRIVGKTSSYTGTSIDIRDQNGDGFADLIIDSMGTSEAFIFNGANSCIKNHDLSFKNDADITLKGENDTYFGICLNFADINGDSYADTVIGADKYATFSGRTYVFLSNGPNGILSKNLSTGETADITITGEIGSYFGIAVGAGDLNGDGYSDILGGATMYSNSTGRSYTVYGPGSSPSSIILPGGADSYITGENTNTSFGASFGTGDINGDLIDDVIVGAWKTNSNQGSAYLFNGTPSGVNDSSAASADAVFTGEATSHFGFKSSCTDVNGDNYADAVIGAYTANANTGRVYIFLSSGTSGIQGSISAASADTVITGESSSELGYSIAP